MIPQAAITEWGRTVPWPTVEQIEQDLLLSRLIVEIANDDAQRAKHFSEAAYLTLDAAAEQLIATL